MSLESTIRKAVSKADKVFASIQSPIIHEAWISQSGFGSPVYAAPVTRNAIVETVNRIKYQLDGRQVYVSYRVTIPRPIAANGAAGRIEPVDARDRITLSDGVSYPVVSVEGVKDGSTGLPFMVEIELGR